MTAWDMPIIMKGLPSGVRKQARLLRSPMVQGAGWAATETVGNNGSQARMRAMEKEDFIMAAFGGVLYQKSRGRETICFDPVKHL